MVVLQKIGDSAGGYEKNRSSANSLTMAKQYNSAIERQLHHE